MSILRKLHENKLLGSVPSFIPETSFEVIMGSSAYGVSNNTSDVDVYAMCVPPQEMLFPHLVGHVAGFGNAPEGFDTFQKHHIELDDKEYDVAVHNIVKYFDLCATCNPNMIDSLFVPRRCISHLDQVGKILRDNRRKFLHKGAFHKFKGYAYGQMGKYVKRSMSESEQAVIDFRNNHSIKSLDIINTLHIELKKRGLQDAVQKEKHNR